MDVLERLVGEVALPSMTRVRQKFDGDKLDDIAGAVRAGIDTANSDGRIRSGMSVAVAVGSRGLADLPTLTRATVDGLKAHGARPFIVPAMGSHGGATAEGQVKLLGKMGVTEESAGCEIRSSMETVELGRLENGLPVLMDRHAMEADGIVVLNRVKPHTSFSAAIESGLCKMIVIGLGKQRGAESCHARGFGEMAENVVEMARLKLEKLPFLFGVASVENAYDEVCRVEVVPAERIIEAEPELLAEARRRLPKILFNPLDVLVIDQMGKEFSGTGMDPNITGRASTPYLATELEVSKMVVLDLTDKGGGNAAGIGLADTITKRLFDKVDLTATYANHITSTTLSAAKIPMIMETDKLAITTAAKTSLAEDLSRLRMVRIPNTLHIGEILISDALLAEAREHPQIEIVGDAKPWPFDPHGALPAF